MEGVLTVKFLYKRQRVRGERRETYYHNGNKPPIKPLTELPMADFNHFASLVFC